MIGDDDLEGIFANGDFDAEAVFTISTGPTVTLAVRGWFTGRTDSLNLMDGQPQVNDARFDCETADVATVKNGMSVVINGVTYEVKQRENLGTGVTSIVLKT